MNDPDIRASDITNAVEEIAIGHRIVLLQRACKLIVDKTPSANNYASGVNTKATIVGVHHTQGRVSYPHWTDFLTEFGTAYRGDCAIGNPTSITALKLMSITDGTNITFSSWSMMPNSNVVDFNGDMMSMGYGWVSDDTATGFTANKLWVFQKATTLGYVQRMGMDQDEIERVAGPRKVRRWLGTESLFCTIYTAGMRSFDFNAPSVTA